MASAVYSFNVVPASFVRIARNHYVKMAVMLLESQIEKQFQHISGLLEACATFVSLVPISFKYNCPGLYVSRYVHAIQEVNISKGHCI